MNIKSENIENNNYFPSLTGVRAIAAYMVCICHFNPFTAANFGDRIHNFFNEFHIGVTVFFVLSGFLITFRYYGEKKINFKNYMVNRVARIYPVYFILTTILLFFIWMQSGFGNTQKYFVQYLFNITFLRGLFNDYIFTGIFQGWSLTVEEMFYFLAPLFFILLKRNFKYIFILPSFIFLFGLILFLVFRQVSFLGFMSDLNLFLSYSFFGRVFEFFVGIFMAILFKKSNLSRNMKFNFTYLGVLGIIFSVFCISLYADSDGLGIRKLNGKIINNFILPIVGIGPLFWGLLTEKTKFRSLLETKVMIFLGKVSYVFYLIHIQVGMFEDNIIFVILIGTIVSSLVYILIEEPLNKMIRNKFHTAIKR